MTALLVVGLIGVGGAMTAAAATPPPSHHFTGSGGNSWNEGSSWVRHGTSSFSFGTSTRAYSAHRHLMNFRGNYTTACSGRRLRLFASGILVRKDGSFTYRFHYKSASVKIWGHFKRRNQAIVNYLVNFSGSPNYNQNKPAALKCAAWVRGTANG